ncbi:cupin domain-containing protein [Marinobacter sp.]|uniref:cupin domain-containing protein n=1 Tax=Marinobacter sp. TaxID=50741 RepID=UPI003566A923
MEKIATNRFSVVRIAAVGILAVAFGSASVEASEAGIPYQGDGHIMIEPSELTWKPVASMAKGAKIAVLEGDMSSGDPFTIRLQLPADYEVAPHIHPAYERVTVLSGTFHFAHGEEFERSQLRALPTGSLAIMAPGEPMFGYTEEQTVIQLHGTGPWGIEYINPEDDPRK